jgi:HK97 family phage prohead protease
MEADFSGWATKADLKCTDGRTILPDAFKHQHEEKVPLVWQHGHKEVTNVLGHAILEHRPEGVYTRAFFNDTPQGQHAKKLVQHGDITMMSIWANELVERAKRVMHGAIREVSLVISGANPGAVIDYVNVVHGDFDENMDDEAIITTGLEIMHGDGVLPPDHSDDSDSTDGADESDESDQSDESDSTDAADESDESDDPDGSDIQHAAGEMTIQDVYNSFTEEQKAVLHFMVGEALQGNDPAAASLQQDALGEEIDIEGTLSSLSDIQKDVLHYMIGEAIAQAEANEVTHNNTQEGSDMQKNVFDQNGQASENTLSHSDMEGIRTSLLEDGKKRGSLRDAVDAYKESDEFLSHGIENIDILFPDAVALDKTPEFLQRRTEWVAKVLGGARKSPFNRIKTVMADITMDEARAKGYIKGNMKKEEFFSVSKRVTLPTTIYKKQKLDRDDIIDITDFDVVAWLKAEMRLMLDEEIARAILIGDGRDVASDDKIPEIRPIASDHELYVTTINVNLDDASSNVGEVIDALILNRQFLKGSGQPTMFTTENMIARFMLHKDGFGRRMYRSLDELATELRVSDVVPVEVMEEDDSVVAIVVNMADYVIGATGGGAVTMFDDFDIDYNQHKYLIETRMCGALTRLKSALVVRKVAGTDILRVPTPPSFNPTTNVVTIPTTTGVVYKNDDTNATLTAGAQPALAEGATLRVRAEATAGSYLATSEDDEWEFTNETDV